MTSAVPTTVLFNSALNPQRILAASLGRVAIIFCNLTPGILYFNPLPVESIGGQFVIANGLNSYLLKWRDVGDLLETEWYADLTPGGVFAVTEIVVS